MSIVIGIDLSVLQVPLLFKYYPDGQPGIVPGIISLLTHPPFPSEVKSFGQVF